jgi:hypothetical protein
VSLRNGTGALPEPPAAGSLDRAASRNVGAKMKCPAAGQLVPVKRDAVRVGDLYVDVRRVTNDTERSFEVMP